MTRRFGLIGRNISYSFSKTYFSEKFDAEGLSGCSYENFDIASIDEVPFVFNQENLGGLNVTIPYKEQILPYLDALSPVAAEIGAVNTIAFENGKTVGYNTDYFGFGESLKPLLTIHHEKALILGTGGASKAVAYALQALGIGIQFASSRPQPGMLAYEEIDLSPFQIVINATPLGTSPNVEASPDIPYHQFSAGHIAYDLIYNPAETLFLKKAAEQGAVTKNGYEMLVRQAEKAWEIWNHVR